MSARAIAQFVEVLSKHRENYDGDCNYYAGCECGWNNGTDEHNDGFPEHLAEVLKPAMLDSIARSMAATAERMTQTPPMLKDQYIRALQGIAGGLHEEANILRAAAKA